MNYDPSSNLPAAVGRLRERLELAEATHRKVMEELRMELAALERRIPYEVPPVAQEVVYTSTPPVEKPPQVEEPLLKALQEAKSAALPPPLPRAEDTFGDASVEKLPVPEKRIVPSKPALPPPLPAGAAFEQELGRVWLVRIGMVLLITGMVLGANWAYKNWIHHLPPGVRLAGLYFCSLLIGGIGIRLTKKEGYKRYGEVLVAGGLAFFYYCTYAAHHVTRLRVIESPVTAGVLLLGAAALIAAVSWFRQSRTTAVMGIVLASYATMIQPLDWLSAASNLMLAIAGIVLMLRPGWGAPGIASLVGTYAAFGGWQILGAAGNGTGDTRATLWFLPASWAIFAIPGMLGRFRDSLGERGRAFFTAANNGLFFLTFSVIWVRVYGPHDFWQIPAIFGAVLLVMGAIGRKREDAAAASNVIQSLALLSLAMVLKLEGYHLALGLAGECLALTIAYHRFRKYPEFAFSLLAGMGAAALTIGVHLPDMWMSGMPPWSGALAAVLVALSAVIFRLNVERAQNPEPYEVRAAVGLMAYSALTILILGWALRLPNDWQLPVMTCLSTAFAAVSLLVDRKRWMPELAWCSGVCGIIATGLIAWNTPLWGESVALAAGLAGCVLWHRTQVPPRTDVVLAVDPINTPQPFAWLMSLFVPLLCGRMLGRADLSNTELIGALAGAAVALVAIARPLKATRLEFTAPFLNIGALLMVLTALVNHDPSVSKLVSFAPSAAAAIILLIVNFRRTDWLLPQVLIARGTLFVGWTAALLFAIPEGFVDLIALSAIAAFVVAAMRKQVASLDAWGWTGVSLLAFIELLLEGKDSSLHGYLFEGVGLIALLAGIAMKTPKLPLSLQQTASKLLPWIACLMVTVWSTHIVVDQFGWRGVAVLWTVLGFGLVTFGLVLSRFVSRQVGFILLSMALLKLFLVDVWDFTTFMRVVSFIALGLALVILGLFYHRFVPAVKKLLDEDAARNEI